MRTPDEDSLRRRHKVELRRRMLAVRNALPDESRAQRRAKATAHARSLDWEGIQSVASYSPIRGELEPGPLEDWLRGRGTSIAYPCIDHETQTLVLRRAERAELTLATFGILEPPASCPVVENVDLVIVPGLAIDTRGHRIGYGRGYYDRLLTTLPDAQRVAFVYDFQLIPEAPNQSGDVPVHRVVSDERVMECQETST